MFRGLVLAVLLAFSLTLGVLAPVFAADPSAAATPGASSVIIDPLDPRAGESASRVGAPLLSIVLVLAVGTITVAATVAFVRVTRRA